MSRITKLLFVILILGFTSCREIKKGDRTKENQAKEIEKIETQVDDISKEVEKESKSLEKELKELDSL